MVNNEQIVSASLTDDGRLEVVTRAKSGHAYGAGLPVPDKVTKRVYAAVDGRIVLERTVEGRHTPQRFIPEAIEFDSKAAGDAKGP